MSRDTESILRVVGPTPARRRTQASDITRAWDWLRDRARARWAKLTAQDMARINGSLERLVGRLQQYYGLGRDEIARAVAEMLELGPGGNRDGHIVVMDAEQGARDASIDRAADS